MSKIGLIILNILLLLISSLGVAEPVFTVGFAQDTLANDWRLAQVKAVQEELAKEKNIRLIIKDAKGSASLQVNHIEEFIDQKIDVLITSPMTAAILTPVISKAYKADLPVILLDRGVLGNDYTSFIRPDNRPIAKAAAEYLVKELNKKGTILVLEGLPGATPTIHRTDEFNHIIQQYPEINTINVIANYLRADAIKAVSQLLESNQKFDAIYAQSDSMASGARMALEFHRIDPKTLPIVGIDYIKEAQKAILEGKQSASFTYPTGGEEGARAAISILKGGKVPKEIVIDSIMVTRENADKVAPIF